MSDIFDWTKVKKNHPFVGGDEVMLQDIRNQQIQTYIDLGRMQQVGQYITEDVAKSRIAKALGPTIRDKLLLLIEETP
jgi:hypothetical protein